MDRNMGRYFLQYHSKKHIVVTLGIGTCNRTFFEAKVSNLSIVCGVKEERTDEKPDRDCCKSNIIRPL